MIHTGIKPSKCIYCHKSFTRRGTINAYAKIHTAEKQRYTCDRSGRPFLQRNAAIERTEVNNRKSLCCDKCDEAFAKKRNILKNIVLHEDNNYITHDYVEIQQEIAVDVPRSILLTK